jgi:hypothetical protein
MPIPVDLSDEAWPCCALLGSDCDVPIATSPPLAGAFEKYLAGDGAGHSVSESCDCVVPTKSLWEWEH